MSQRHEHTILKENGDKIKLLVNEIYSIDAFLEMYVKNMMLHLDIHQKLF